MNRVIHFEIQADNIERAKKFYEKALGWKIEKVMSKDNGPMDYWMIMTDEKDSKEPGINGGLYERPKDDKHFLFDCTVDVKDIDKSIKDVKANGGTILREKMELKGVGFFAAVKDPEGNKFSLMQSTMEQK